MYWLRVCVLLAMVGIGCATLDSTDHSKCGTKKQCIQVPEDCTDNCDMIVTFAGAVDGSTVSFEVQANYSNQHDDFWIGIGFSKDQTMQNAAFTICMHDPKWTPQDQLVFASSGSKKKADLLTNVGATDVATLKEVGKVNTDVVCRFEQTVVPAAANSTNVWDLASANFYILVAYGKPGSKNQLTAHKHDDKNRWVSAKQYNVTAPFERESETENSGEQTESPDDDEEATTTGDAHGQTAVFGITALALLITMFVA